MSTHEDCNHYYELVDIGTRIFVNVKRSCANWALGFFAVGHFAVGQFAVRNLKKKKNLTEPNLT